MARSNLLRISDADTTLVGSFAVPRAPAPFRPSWASQDTSPPAETATEADEDLFALGVAEGRRAAEQAMAEARAAIARLTESLEVLRPEPTNALALLLAETVERLVTQIVGQVEVDGDLLRARAEAAAALIGNETAAARMRVHPDDLPFFIGARVPVEIMADPAIERGGLRLETGQGWIEDGPSVRLDRLRAELDRLGAPQ